jgi:hypothetical protein
MQKLLTQHVDKIAHFSLMYLICDVLMTITNVDVMLYICVGLTFGLASIKEFVLSDYADFKDWITTILGGFLAIIINT